MVRAKDLRRAQMLAAEAVRLCEAGGESLAAAHLQHGLDMLTGAASAALREERSPWGSEEP
jgi:hypothetical protein